MATLRTLVRWAVLTSLLAAVLFIAAGGTGIPRPPTGAYPAAYSPRRMSAPFASPANKMRRPLSSTIATMLASLKDTPSERERNPTLLRKVRWIAQQRDFRAGETFGKNAAQLLHQGPWQFLLFPPLPHPIQLLKMSEALDVPL